MAKDAENQTNDDNVTTAETPMTTPPAAARSYEVKDVDTTVEDENKEETKKQVENDDQFIEDTGQLSEDTLGDYQRRVQLGVNPNDLSYDDDDEDDDDGEADKSE